MKQWRRPRRKQSCAGGPGSRCRHRFTAVVSAGYGDQRYRARKTSELLSMAVFIRVVMTRSITTHCQHREDPLKLSQARQQRSVLARSPSLRPCFLSTPETQAGELPVLGALPRPIDPVAVYTAPGTGQRKRNHDAVEPPAHGLHTATITAHCSLQS